MERCVIRPWDNDPFLLLTVHFRFRAPSPCWIPEPRRMLLGRWSSPDIRPMGFSWNSSSASESMREGDSAPFDWQHPISVTGEWVSRAAVGAGEAHGDVRYCELRLVKGALKKEIGEIHGLTLQTRTANGSARRALACFKVVSRGEIGF